MQYGPHAFTPLPWLPGIEALLLLWKFILAFPGGHWEVVAPWGVGEIGSWLSRCPKQVAEGWGYPMCPLGPFPLSGRVAGLKGLLAAPWVVAAAVAIELGCCGLLNMESIGCEVVLGGQSPDEDREQLPG